jgi:hypothetical protein
MSKYTEIINLINDPIFQNLLGHPVVCYQPVHRSLSSIVNNSNIKNNHGIYFMFDDTTYAKPALWYIGISGSQPYRTRVGLHRGCAVNPHLRGKGSPVPQTWQDCHQWLTSKGHQMPNGPWDTNCQIVWLEIATQLSKPALELLENLLIYRLNPIVNDSFDWSQANQL